VDGGRRGARAGGGCANLNAGWQRPGAWARAGIVENEPSATLAASDLQVPAACDKMICRFLVWKRPRKSAFALLAPRNEPGEVVAQQTWPIDRNFCCPGCVYRPKTVHCRPVWAESYNPCRPEPPVSKWRPGTACVQVETLAAIGESSSGSMRFKISTISRRRSATGP